MPCGFVELFDCPIESEAHAVCCVASALRKADAWFVLPNVGRADCLAFHIVGVVFGQAGTFAKRQQIHHGDGRNQQQRYPCQTHEKLQGCGDDKGI